MTATGGNTSTTQGRTTGANDETNAGRRLISIVTPVYNEEENVEILFETVVGVMAVEAEHYDIEVIFTDNHSTDTTFEKLKGIAANDPRVRVFRFSRNFGYQKSIYTGYMKARGDAAIQLDCDLQDPPSLIPQFLRLWEQGYQVVYGVRRTRNEGWLLRGTRHAFYWLVDALSNDQLPRDAGDFRLIDRRIIEELRNVRDTNLYIRGRLATMGFKQIGVPYDRDKRRHGESKFGLASMVGLAIDAVISHSVVPLRLATYLGLFSITAALLGMVGYASAYFLVGRTWPAGFTTIVVLLLLNVGLTSLFLGIIGEYLARIYEQIKMSPDTIIEIQIPENDSA